MRTQECVVEFQGNGRKEEGALEATKHDWGLRKMGTGVV